MLLKEKLAHLFLLKNKKQHRPLLRLHFVSRNISLYRDTAKGICDRICKKVLFSHIKFDPFVQLSNFVTFVSLQAHICTFP